MFRVRLAPKPRSLFFHSGGILTDKSERVEFIAQDVVVEVLGQGRLRSLARLVKALQCQQAIAQVHVGGADVRREAEILAMRFRRFVILCQRGIRNAESAVSSIVTRVILNPFLISLRRLIELASHEAIVVSRNRKFLPLTGVGTKLKGFALILAGPSEFSQAGIAVGQSPVSRGKIRVEFDGALIVSDRCRGAFLPSPPHAEAERFQGLERRSGRLAERHIELLYCSQRFTP